MYRSCVKQIKEKGRPQVPSAVSFLPEIAVQKEALRRREKDPHGLHETQELADLVVGEVRREKQHPGHKSCRTAF